MKLPKLNDKWGVALGVAAFLLIVSIYALEIPFFNRYFSFSSFLIFGEVFGLFLGGIAAWYFGKNISDNYDLMRLRIGMVAAGLIFGPLFFSLLNRHLDPWPQQIELVEFAGYEERISSRYGIPDPEESNDSNAHHVYFYRDGELSRIVLSKAPQLDGVQEGDQIGIKVRKGLFGLEWMQGLRTGEDTPSII